MSHATPREPRKRELSPERRQRLVELARVEGFRKLAERLGIHPQTLAAVCAGFPVNPSTIALLERLLDENAAGDP